MNEALKSTQTTPTIEQQKGLHPMIKAAILSIALAVTGCAKNADVDGGEPDLRTEQIGDLDSLTPEEIKAQACLEVDHTSGKYEECLTTKPSPAEYAGGKYLQCLEDKSHRGYHTVSDDPYTPYSKVAYAKQLARPRSN